MFKKIAIFLLVAIVGFLAFVATRPSNFHVERQATVAAPVDIPFAMVNDFHNWGEWSPWEKLDPAQKRTMSGPANGQGAVYHWTGNDKVGEGEMTITKSSPPSEIDIKLEFMKPWKAINVTHFTFKPTGAETSQVTWSMDGTNDFVGKLFGVFMNMDKLVGADFERGLAAMSSVGAARHAAAKKAAEEAKAKADAEAKAAADASAAEEAKAAEEAAAKTPAKKK